MPTCGGGGALAPGTGGGEQTAGLSGAVERGAVCPQTQSVTQ